MPARLPRAEALLFCPHCSAPQILLPEHMRVEVAGVTADEPALPARSSTPGTNSIDWRVVLPTAAWVAAAGGLMSVAGLTSEFVDYLAPLWVLASGSVVLGVYLRRRPGAWMTGQAGWRIGLVTGLLLVGAKGVGLSATGVLARFATHSMARYDAQTTAAAQVWQQQAFAGRAPQESDKLALGWYQDQLASPERRAGWTLASAGMIALFVVLFAGLSGLFSGAIERRRRLVAGRG